MNLLILTALYPPAAGGAATYYGELVAALREREEITRIVILTEQQPNFPARAESDRVIALRMLPPRVSRDKANPLIHATTYLLTDAFLLTRLPGIARQYEIDAIQFHSRYRSPLTHLALQRTGCVVLADLRDRMLDPRRVTFCHAILCCAENLRQLALARGISASKLFYIPNPVPRFDKPTPDRVRAVLARYAVPHVFLLFVGDITPAKGIFELLDGFEIHTCQTHDAPTLILVGANREGARFEKRVKQVARARYLGTLPRQDVLALMQQASAVLLPSKSEGLPTVILEALALGCRVMCPPDVDEFERLCPEWTLKQVSAQAIADFLSRFETPTDRPSVPLDDYALPRVVDKLLEVYSYVLAHRH